MNISPTQRRLAWVCTVLALFVVSSRAVAQCDIATPFAQPVQLTIYLDAVNGMAQLDRQTVAPGIISSICIPPYFPMRVRFYDDAAKTSPAGGYISKMYNCGDVATSPKNIWVAVNDGVNYPASESPAVALQVSVQDITAPLVGPLLSVLVNTSDDGNFGDCEFQDAGILNIGLTAVPNSLGLVPNPGEYTDNCLSGVTVNYDIDFDNISGYTDIVAMPGLDAGIHAFPIGVSTVTYHITDASGNVTSFSIDVSVTDNEDPVITCPFDLLAFTPASSCLATVMAPAEADDNCDALEVSWMAPTATPASGFGNLNAQFPVGTTTVTYTATDGGGLTATCTFDVQVVDNTGPQITCPANAVKRANALNCTYMAVGTEFDPTGLGDNCSFTPSATNPQNSKDGTNSLAGEVFPLGATIVTWTVTDLNANIKTCSFTVTVTDNTPPSVAFSVNLGPFNVTPGDCSKVATYTEPSNTMPGSVDCNGPVTLTRDSVFLNGDYTPGFLAAAPAFNPAVAGSVTTQFPVGVTQIQYTWRDAANNKSFRYVTVTVVENELPVAKCKNTPIYRNLNANTGTIQLVSGDVDNGSTDNCGINTYDLVPEVLTCDDVENGPTTVVLTVTDNAGNSSTCAAQVTVFDVTPPTIVCPANVVVASDENCEATVPGLFIDEASSLPVLPGQYDDNSSDCGLTQLSYSLNGGPFAPPNSGQLDLSNEIFGTGPSTITIQVQDGSGNASTCIFTVNVTDQQGPTFTAGSIANGATFTQNANLGGCLAKVTWTEPQVGFDCSLPTTLTKSHASGAFFYFGLTTVTYTATDGVGNVSTYTFIINVVDTQKPKAVCQNFTATLSAAGSVVVTSTQIDGGSTDNCFFDYITTSYGPFTCSNLGNNSVQLKIRDGSGNRDSCTATISVIDNLSPVANCAAVLANIDLNAVGQNLFAGSSLNGTTTDNCSGSLGYMLSVDGSAFASTFAFTCAHLGVRTLVLRATDGGGNTSTCSKVVTVRDVTAPTFTVPASRTVKCYEAIGPIATGNFSNLADACDANPTITFVDAVVAGCGGSQTITRTWTARDVSMNIRTASQVISVVDDIKPSFTLPAVVNLNTDNANTCVAPYIATVSATTLKDSCTAFGDLLVTYTVDFPLAIGYVDIVTPTTGTTVLTLNGGYPVGTTAVTWVARDQCGNTKSFLQNVIVKDAKAPVFNYTRCGQTYTLPNTSGSCTQLYAWVRPFPTDLFDCSLVTVTEKFSDASVQGFVDAVNPFLFPFIPIAAQFPAGETTVTYTATDAVGNSSSCAFKVKILDTQAPKVVCPGNQILATTCVTAAVPSYLNNVQVQDNCPTNITLTQTPASGTTLSTVIANPVAGSTFTVKMLAVDRNANNGRDSCSFVVTLADGAAPVPVEQPLLPFVGRCGPDTVLAPLALDPCNPLDSIYGTPSSQVINFLFTNPPSYLLAVGSYVITWSYNDGNGNVSTQQQNINLQNDTFAPEAKCKPAFTINLDSTGAASITTALINNASTDPDGCGAIGLSLNKAFFDCSDEGVNNIVLTVTDNAGNTATCTTAVTVKDVSLPGVLVVPADTLLEACAPIPPAPPISAVDGCSGTLQVVLTTTSTQTASGFNRYNYVITRIWVATDSSGNVVSAQQVITVKDSKPPVFAANTPTTLTFGTSANNQDCRANASIKINQYVTECTPGVTVISSPISFSHIDTLERLAVGVHTFVFTATDSSANSATYTVVVTVADSTLPTAVCINGISAALQNSGSVTVNTSQFNNNSFDNCSPTDSILLRIQRLDGTLVTPSATLTYACADADGVTQHPVKLYVRDKSGNESSCQTYIIIQDNAAPTFTFCPPNKTVDCQLSLNPAMNSNGVATATDNCALNLVLTYSDSITFGTGPAACQLVTRTWQAEDLPGNTATCVQTFTIQDNKPPLFSTLPADATINCSDPLVNPPTVTATDNCSAPADIVITYTEVKTDTAVGACGQYSYKVQRTWMAEDECGNTAVHTQKITVSDTQAPLFPGLQDTLIVLSANHPPTTDCTVLVALNVAASLTDCTPTSALVVSHNSTFAPSGVDASGGYPIGNTKIVFTATDLCGNVGKDSVIVRVQDNSIPTVICNNNVVVALGSTGTAVLQADDIDLGSTDNCGIDTMVLSPSTFDCGDIGDNSVVLTVTDIYGNTNSCTVTVEVSIGPNVGFSLTTTATPESYFGFANGTVTAVATGGSGAFTYAWLPDTTAVTPFLDSLAAGTYILTVLDTMTKCIQTDTAIVAVGDKITVNIDNVSGSPNQLVQVPVTVDNFYQVNGFSFAVISVDTAVGTIVSTNTLNPALLGLSATVTNGKANALWVGGTPLTLPNGTLLFNLAVQLKPNAVIGAVTPVKVVEPFQFLQNINGAATVTMADNINGSVTVIPNANIVKIGGDIQTWKVPTKPVPNVNVALTGSVTATQITDPTGTYLFTVPSASNTVVTPTKITAGNDKISAADLLLIQNHIFGNVLLSPYQWVAANVNNSGGPNPITLADYLLIQRVVLGTDQHIQNSPDWKFIPKSYVFPTPNPLSVPFPTTISHTPATMDFLDDDFVAVRMGDVNGNVVPEFTTSESDDRSEETFRFRLDDRAFRAGEVITVPFKASDFTDRQAYQMTIEFDPAVFALENIGQGVLQLTEDHFGTVHLSDGSLTTVWVSRKPVSFRDDEVLFTLSFRTLQAGQSLREVLHPGSSVTIAEGYDHDGKPMKIDFDFALPTNNPDEQDFALYQNQPNPFQSMTTIGFRLPTTSRATLRVFNASGRLVKTVVGDFEKGYNELNFRPDELGAAGVYWYELETPLHSDRKKMILLK